MVAHHGAAYILILFVGPLLSIWRWSAAWGTGAVLDAVLNATGVAFAFNLVDWLVLDW